MAEDAGEEASRKACAVKSLKDDLEDTILSLCSSHRPSDRCLARLMATDAHRLVGDWFESEFERQTPTEVIVTVMMEFTAAMIGSALVEDDVSRIDSDEIGRMFGRRLLFAFTEISSQAEREGNSDE